MENKNEAMERFLANRIYIYELIHLLFGGIPNEELLNVISTEHTASAFKLLSSEDDDTLDKISKFMRGLQEKRATDSEFIDKVKSEYMKLLIGPGHLIAYPWASTYLGKEKMLFQESTIEVRNIYKKYGFKAQELGKVADDHLSLELHFMAKMSKLAMDAFVEKDMNKYNYYISGQRNFLKEHMLLWIPKYVEDIEKSETAYMYPQFAKALEAFLKVDLEILENELIEDILEKFINKRVSSRDFLKGSMAATTAVSAVSLVGCTSNKVESNDETNNHTPITNPEEGGTWKTAACWHNCGGRCINKVMVKDGAVVRQKTDDSHADSYEFPQQRACVRGHAQQQQCFGADRIKYPMKRKNWEPITGGNKELRGKDEWERISWDEAFELVAAELKHIKENYGNSAFLEAGWGSKYTCSLLNFYGGHTANWDTSSFGSYLADMAKIGLPAYGQGTANDRFDMLNAETIVLYASNPAWSAAGNPAFLFWKAKEAGAKFVVVGPEYNASAQMLDAKWIRVLNGTDTAFLLAVAYEMIRLDKEGEKLIDWDFLHKYCVGFDADSMPSDAKINENFMDYVLGKYDSTPKTPEWATEICGTPVEDITWYAKEISKQRKVMLLFTYGAARNTGAENFPQLFHTVGLMGGHAGKSGHAIGSSYHRHSGNSGPALVGAGAAGLPKLDNPVEHAISAAQVWTAVLTGKYRFAGDCWHGGLLPGEDREIDIRCIFHDSSAWLQTGLNINDGIKAHRKVDFVVSKAQFLTTNAKYSDIILPVTTEWETVGGFSGANREMVVCYQQITEPLYEAKTDQEIDKGIAKALGLNPDELYPISEKQQFFNKIAGCWFVDKNGEKKTLVTITDADIKEWKCEGVPQEGIITIQQLMENGGHQIERKIGDEYTFIGWKDFVENPEANPLPSASGKFEIYSQAKADEFNAIGFDNIDYKPYPHYIVPKTGYETTFKDGKIGGEKGEYPFLVFNPHYLRRSHSVFDNCPWLRETWKNPVFLSAQDAKEKGIENGDTVLIYNEYGKVLRQASIVETYMPGVVGLPHGAWVDMDEETGIDKAGADNVLCGPVLAGMGISGYNNYNCNFEKYTGEALTPDHLKPQNIF